MALVCVAGAYRLTEEGFRKVAVMNITALAAVVGRSKNAVILQENFA